MEKGKITPHLRTRGNYIMNKPRIIYLQILAVILFAFISLKYLPDASVSTAQRINDCEPYNHEWGISTPSSSLFYNSLPDFLYTDSGSSASISRIIADAQDGDYIGFFSFQQQILVYIGDELIYSFIPGGGTLSSTPGNKWNFIPLSDEYNGKKLTIQVYECYSDGRVAIPAFYYGSQHGIAAHYIKIEAVHIMISFFTIIIGIGLGFFCILYRKNQQLVLGLKWLALFALFRGIWSSIETNVYSLFFTHLLFFSQLSYLCLKLATVSFLQFINVTFHHGQSRFLKLLTLVSIADFWITGILQFKFGIDFASTVFATHFIMLSGGAYAAYISISSLREKLHEAEIVALPSKKRNAYVAQIMCTLTVIATSLIDLVRYYMVNSPDIAKFCRLGDIIYITTISITLFLDFISIVQMGFEAEHIKEEAAIDPMTKLRNRSTFEMDVMRGTQRQWERKGIIVLDLNNLKYFNDVLGHDMGDYYIIAASEVISDVYSQCGNVYRIGGDEFCVIAGNLEDERFLELRTIAEKRIEEIIVPERDIHMEISAGYARFDAKLDYTLRDTMKRADKAMYSRKVELKARHPELNIR